MRRGDVTRRTAAHKAARTCVGGTSGARTTRSTVLGRRDDSLEARRLFGVVGVGSGRVEPAMRRGEQQQPASSKQQQPAASSKQQAAAASSKQQQQAAASSSSKQQQAVAASSSKQQQQAAASSSSKQQQAAAASSSKQQQAAAAASSSKQQQQAAASSMMASVGKRRGGQNGSRRPRRRDGFAGALTTSTVPGLVRSLSVVGAGIDASKTRPE
jgi:alanyl-tRNA synthetase